MTAQKADTLNGYLLISTYNSEYSSEHRFPLINTQLELTHIYFYKAN